VTDYSRSVIKTFVDRHTQELYFWRQFHGHLHQYFVSRQGCLILGKRWLSDELVVLGMASYPEPRDAVFHAGTNGTPVEPDASRPKLADALEMY